MKIRGVELKVVLVLLSMLIFAPNVYSAVITNCSIITTPGEVYYLTNDIKGLYPGENFCIAIYASDVVLNCDNHEIRNNESENKNGILVNTSLEHVTIENCRIANYTWGINFDQINNSIIQNNLVNESIGDGSWAIFLSNSNSNNITNNTLVANFGTGVWADQSTNNRFIGNNVSNNSGQGFYLASTNNSILFNNTIAKNNDDGVHVTGGINLSITNNYIGSNHNNGIYVVSSSNNNTITNNVVYNNSLNGILIDTSYNNVSENIISSSVGVGLWLTSASINNTCSNNIVYNNEEGIVVSSAYYGNFLYNNSAYNNVQYGLYISYSEILAKDTHLYNNSAADFYAESGSAYNMNLSNLTFDNPYGNFVNYTSLDIVDVIGDPSGESYQIKWSTMPSGLTTTLSPLFSKFINITNVSGPASIDDITWLWTDDESTGYNESNFKLYKYNGTWSNTGATLNTTSNLLNIQNFVPASIFGIIQNSTNCTIIDIPGTYALANDVSGAPHSAPGGNACMKIVVSDVTLDCKGYTILNNAGGRYGIYFNGSITNVSARNCNVRNYTFGIYSYQHSNNSTIIDNTVSDSNYGIYVDYCDYVNVTNNYVFNSSFSGIHLYHTTNNNVSNNAVNVSNNGITFEGASLNNVYGNKAYNSQARGIFLESLSNTNYFFNNDVYNNPTGIHVYSSDDNTFVSDNVHNNSYGMNVESSNRNNASEHFYNNSRDFVVTTSAGSPKTAYLSNSTFDSRAGAFANYSSISLSDFVGGASAESYSISWSPAPVYTPPSDLHHIFYDKYVNITALSGTPSIDSISISWLDSELAGLNESHLELWRHNETSTVGWVLLNNSPNLPNNLISASGVIPNALFGVFYYGDWPIMDNVSPTELLVYDGLETNDVDWFNSNDTLSAHWFNSTDRSRIFFLYRIRQGSACVYPTNCSLVDVYDASSATVGNLSISECKNYTFDVRARDTFYNPSNISSSNGAVADFTKPNMTALASSSHSNQLLNYSNRTIFINWSAADPVNNSCNSGISVFSYSLDHNYSSIPDDIPETNATNVTFTGVRDGVWYFHVKPKDKAGNWGNASTYNISIVAGEPTITLNNLPSPTTEAQVDVTGYVDKLANISLFVNDVNVQNISDNDTFTFSGVNLKVGMNVIYANSSAAGVTIQSNLVFVERINITRYNVSSLTIGCSGCGGDDFLVSTGGGATPYIGGGTEMPVAGSGLMSTLDSGLIFITDPSATTLVERRNKLANQTFYDLANPSIGLPLEVKQNIVNAILSYPDLFISGYANLPTGRYNLIITNNGLVNGKPNITITVQ